MDDVDKTIGEAEATISRVEALLQQGHDILQRGGAVIGADVDAPALARGYIERQPAEHRAEFEREVKALTDEIERDLPRQTATRSVRLKPARQMV